jgi:hypothetical protein
MVCALDLGAWGRELKDVRSRAVNIKWMRMEKGNTTVLFSNSRFAL